MKEYHNYGKPQRLPDYAVHNMLFIVRNHPEFVLSKVNLQQNDAFFQFQFCTYIIDSNPQALGAKEVSAVAYPNLTQANKEIASNVISLLTFRFPSN